ncbi:NAD(P)H-binding protein, partial [Aquipuribacter hungaricus]|uniref:NAD(P)H-binding protein n=1 Tax=Aquipuribacter hungaricus TaxID=545624 RepID=UPI0030EBBD0F
AAREVGVGRLVSVSGAGVTLPGDEKGAGARFVSALTRTFAPDLVADKQGEHDVLASSDLAWTEVRPPRLSEADGAGSWGLTEQAPGLRAAAVSKADVAAAMVELLGLDHWVRRSPFLVAGPDA